ncbi:MAG: HD domain-containing protein [Nitrospirota bacterium]|nr:HD domain-containing protein [Nitrospirota bacterium]
MLPPYVFAYAETLKAEPAVLALAALARQGGMSLWITGGTLRDILLTRWPADLDVAVAGDAMALGRALAAAGHGSFVPLDATTGTARVALRGTQGIQWIDLVDLRGQTGGPAGTSPAIEADLAARDFTVNAIALPLEALVGSAPDTFIDPTGGRPDLHRRVLRMVSAQGLDDDPLRVLRAYRFAATLGFELEAGTRKAAAARVKGLARVAAERVRHELDRLLAAPRPAPALSMLMEDGVLEVLVPELAACRGVAQNHYHHLDVWEHTLEAVSQLAEMVANPGALMDDIGDSDALPWLHQEELRETLRWATLFHDIGKPGCRTEDADGVTHFYGHHIAGAEQFPVIGARLRLPGRLTRRVTRLIRHHLRPLHLLRVHAEGKLTRPTVARLHRDLGDDLPGLFLLARADLAARRGVAKATDADTRLVALHREVEALVRDHIAPAVATPLLTGHDLMHHFGLPEGRRIGRLLGALRMAQAAGEVNDRGQAEAWLRQKLAESGG